jgi:hypothetical protein
MGFDLSQFLVFLNLTEIPFFSALLAGKALEAYARMDRDESKEYIKVKKAILKRYELTSEAYRRKF